jgi:hypothetical protein
MQHLQRLPIGPLAIIGDIHGELKALDDLLRHLDRHHPDHFIVFLGDLADRGPDSPGVIQRVRERMEDGALCVLGNHELSVMRGKDKKYNRWFFGGEWYPEETRPDPVGMEPLAPTARQEVQDFFDSLPLALEREDLRIVHACWDEAAIAGVRGSTRSTLDIYASGPKNPLDEPAANTAYGDGNGPSERDFGWEAQEALEQNGNPISVLTSGKERSADLSRGDRIVWSGNKWRPLVRQRWWEEYDDDTPVVIGHYSRKWHLDHRDEKTELMFPGNEPAGAPVGLHKNVYCVDYSVGTRFHERHQGVSSGFVGRLAALLWRNGKAAEIVFDDGRHEPAQ